MLELSICQPEHPNQAVFIQTVDISLEDFRDKIDDSAFIFPEEWVFMTRAGSLIATDQEKNTSLSLIVRQREDNTTVSDVMIAPALTYQPPPTRPMVPRTGRGALESFAEIVGALRDVYVTSIQPNLHEFIRPMLVAAIVAAILAFILSGILVLSLGVLDGISLTFLKPLLRNHLCGKEFDVAAQVPALNNRIQELEWKVKNLRQVEVGTFFCKDDHHMYEELETTTLFVPFRKTNFTDTPHVNFGLRGVSVDDVSTVRLEDLRVNRTGFSIRCSYFGKWMHYSLEYSWVAVGK